VTCEQRKDLMFDYLTGAMDAADQKALRTHLASGCPACAGSLAQAQATLASLPVALEPVAPSPVVKQRLMDRISAAESTPAKAPAMKITPSSGGADDRIPDTPALRLFRIFVPAAVAAGIAIMVTHALVMRKVEPELLRSRASEMLIAQQDQRIKSLLATVSNQRQVVEMLRSPNLKMVQLDGAAQPSAVARIIWDQKTNDWLVLADGLTPPPPGKVYELWYIPANASPVNAGTFTVDASGRGTMMTKVPPNVGPFAVAAVTIEQAGGSATPTMPLQLASKASGT
jgi:anti-sigma-K factor RskA